MTRHSHIKFRLHPERLELLTLAAEQYGMNVADFILRAAVEKAEKITAGSEDPFYDFMTRREKE